MHTRLAYGKSGLPIDLPGDWDITLIEPRLVPVLPYPPLALRQALHQPIQTPGFLEQDQWQAQIQAMIQLNAEVYVYSDHLSDEQITHAMIKPCRDIPDTVAVLRRRFGEDVQIAVMPEGPQTIAYLDPEVV